MLAGALARFKRGGILEDLTTRLTALFADNLKAAAEAPVPAPAPLDAGDLLSRLIWDRPIPETCCAQSHRSHP
jgi:hypothetical protein